MPTRPAVHLAIAVDDLSRARQFYGSVLGLPEGRSTEQWIDWDLHGHQLVTHVVADGPSSPGASSVDGHAVPIPHFGLLLETARFHELADRLRGAGVDFLVEPYLRFPGEPAEQWTMFFRDPSGNALEFKAFRDESKVFTP
ncbi:VOC family protein [Streptomyces sp. CWNU-52B]|uniref:VOC family protein n=1 Tax=unclassified Streptomyces TaxID=2593676 RepID=UPI0039BF6A7A